MKKHPIRKRGERNLTLKLVTKPMSPTQLAKLLSEAGGAPIGAATIRSHMAAGAPADKRQRLCLVDYAGWLIAQLKSRRRSSAD